VVLGSLDKDPGGSLLSLSVSYDSSGGSSLSLSVTYDSSIISMLLMIPQS
jgi:hypothetical protein